MNKFFKAAILCGVCVLPINVYAQTAVTINNPDEKLVIQNSAETEPQLVPVELVKDPTTNRVAAKLAEVEDQGAGIGLDRILIEGELKEEDLGNGKKRVSVIWDSASMIDDVSGEKKTTPFGIPFNSKVIAKPKLEGGDKFNAEGNPLELMLAYQRLIQKDTEQDTNEDISEDEEDTTPTNEKNAGGGTDAEGEALEYKSPEFTTDQTEDPMITTEVCNIRIDIEQMAAIEQERVLVDGVEESDCEDTLTRYPITKKYNACPLTFDTDAMVAYQQYVLIYNNPNDGEVQVQGCTADEENTIALQESTEGCSIRHDFAQGISYQQASIVYEHNGALQTLEDCHDTDTTYDHVVTQDGCDPIIANDEVTFQNRTTIDVDSTTIEILACAPDTSSTTAVEEEICDSPRYTHDFDSNQSYLNKNYYYIDNGQRVDIQSCAQSDVTFEHKEDESVCDTTNDDTTKTSTMHAKTYIEETAGNKTYISSCQALSPSIPYTLLENRWKIASSTNATLDVNGSDGTYKNQYFIHHDYINAQYAGGLEYKATNLDHLAGLEGKYALTTTSTPRAGSCYYASNSLFIAGQKYCITGELSNDWTISGSITLNKALSTDVPFIIASTSPVAQSSGSSTYEWKYPSNLCAATYDVTFSCQLPTCLHTHLRSHPVWLRGDNSEFMDTTVTTDNLHICGDGSAIDGTAN